MKKLFCILLALSLILGILTGCGINIDAPAAIKPSAQAQEIQYNKHLVYTMTQNDIDTFCNDLLALEQMYMQNATIEEIDTAEDALEELFDYINDQCAIANILYCYDTTNQSASDRFLQSQEWSNQATDVFMLCARRIYESDAHNKDYFFSEWTDAEIEKLMHYTSRVAELEQQNAELLVAYRDLKNKNSGEMIPIYRQLVQNNNEIAAIYHYDNFYEYAYSVEYDRDYAPAEVDKIQTFAKMYLQSTCIKALDAFVEGYQGLTAVQKTTFSNLLSAPYEKFGEVYVNRYLQALPETAQNGMKKMTEEERVVFTDGENAREGAFTTLVGSEPFCFFGPGYQNISTVIHELGHFYGAVEGNLNETPLDLAETQSQGNEWLFTAYLEEFIPETIYQVYVGYCIYDVIAGTLVQLAVDAFEKAVYTHPDVENLTQEDFDQIMADVAETFGGIEFFDAYITDLQSYWKIVVVESPVYYVSYAVSNMAALNIFTLAQEDREEATSVYCRLAQIEDYDDGFLAILADSGLPGPFQADVYMDIYKMFS